MDWSKTQSFLITAYQDCTFNKTRSHLVVAAFSFHGGELWVQTMRDIGSIIMVRAQSSDDMVMTIMVLSKFVQFCL